MTAQGWRKRGGGRAAEDSSVVDSLFECDIKPRPLSYPLNTYHIAMSEGELHYTWTDKPHRLVYDLIAAVKYYATKVDLDYKAIGKQAYESGYSTGYMDGAIKAHESRRLELIGHADLAINNIHIFNGYGEDVPEGRTPLYAGYNT